VRASANTSGNRPLLGLALLLPAALELGGCACPCVRGTPTVFGYSHERRPITGTVHGTGPETHLVFGVIHGNEPLGKPLLERLQKHLVDRPDLLEGRKVVVIPVLNPDGLARRSRTNARGVDLNRNFPAGNWTPAPRHGGSPGSEVETRVLLELIRRLRPGRILAVHSPLHCVNFDGPAEELAGEMALAAGYPLRESIGYETPGSLGSYTGRDLGIPSITLEIARGATEDDVWPTLGPAIEVFLLHPGTGLGE
jgi:protein MpaA